MVSAAVEEVVVVAAAAAEHRSFGSSCEEGGHSYWAHNYYS